MRYWRLDHSQGYGQPRVQLDVTHAAGLFAALGDWSALAGAVLQTAGAVVPLAQCTIFAYELTNRPRILSVADYRGGRFLHDVAEAYTRQFYVLDGNQSVMGTDAGKRYPSALWLHQQSSADIEHTGYRSICYQQPNVCDRIALLVQAGTRIWLSINLYRDRDGGHFLPGDIASIEALAPIFAHAARHNYALSSHTEIIPLMLSRLLSLCPGLPKRELDVVRGVLDGQTANQIAENMGIKPASVVTYQKRAYRRLGIANQRQLFSLCIAAKRI